MGGEADARRGLGLTPERASATTAAPTNPELDTDRKVIAAATPGPWYTFRPPWFRDDLGVLAGSSDPHVATFVADLSPMDALDDVSGKWAQNPADAEFIARARTRWPQAIERLAEVERAARDYLEATTSSADTASWGDYAQRESRLARLVGYTIPEVERGGAG